MAVVTNVQRRFGRTDRYKQMTQGITRVRAYQYLGYSQDKQVRSSGFPVPRCSTVKRGCSNSSCKVGRSGQCLDSSILLNHLARPLLPPNRSYKSITSQNQPSSFQNSRWKHDMFIRLGSSKANRYLSSISCRYFMDPKIRTAPTRCNEI